MAPPKKTVNGKKLIPEVVKAAVGAQSFTQATRELSKDDKKLLSRALRMDVEQWRSEFGNELRNTASEMLTLIKQELGDIPPAARAYTLAVLVDKAAALEGRSATQNAGVNIQINNYGDMSKEELMAKLSGKLHPDDGKKAESVVEVVADASVPDGGEVPLANNVSNVPHYVQGPVVNGG